MRGDLDRYGWHPWLVVRRAPRRAGGVRRPDVFNAGVAGAPVTAAAVRHPLHERYSISPTRTRGLERISTAATTRHLSAARFAIHGSADDNVVVAHALQMSAALRWSPRIPHELVLIPGASHMGGCRRGGRLSRYLLELDFLRRSLGLQRPDAG